MKRALATLTAVAMFALPLSASAGETWDAIKEEWEYRPYAVILAIPAFLVTSPFMFAKWLMSEDEE